MKHFAFIIAVFFPLLCHGVVSADTAALRAATQHPDVRALRERAMAFEHSAKASNSLSGPEAEFEYKIPQAGGVNRWGVSVGQSFDWPGVYGARAEAAKFRSEAFRNEYRAEVQQKWLLVRQAIIRYHQTQDLCSVLAEARTNYSELKDRKSVV